MTEISEKIMNSKAKSIYDGFAKYILQKVCWGRIVIACILISIYLARKPSENIYFKLHCGLSITTCTTV